MATFYVNSITGNDSNSGTSWALAKKTLSGASGVASTGDTIYCHGLFAESVPVAKRLKWQGVGQCHFDGTGLNGPRTIDGMVFCNVLFKNFVDGCIYPMAVGSTFCYDCIFQDSPVGVAVGYYSAAVYCERCIFTNISTAAVLGTGSTVYGSLRNCVFSGNTVSINSGGSSGSVLAVRNTFRDPIVWSCAASFVAADSDNNVYDFAAGKSVIGGVDKTTMSAFLASLTAPREAASIDRAWASDVGDAANKLFRPTPASYLLTAGIGSSPIGLTQPAVTISNITNASLWTGGVFSNTELDGSGYLVLSAGQTSGYWRSDIIDFGASINAKSLEVSVAGENATNYIDYDTGDSPRYFNVRVRGSNTSFLKTDGSPSWVTVPRRAEIGAYMSNALRYWQVELTLRGP